MFGTSVVDVYTAFFWIYSLSFYPHIGLVCCFVAITFYRISDDYTLWLRDDLRRVVLGVENYAAQIFASIDTRFEEIPVLLHNRLQYVEAQIDEISDAKKAINDLDTAIKNLQESRRYERTTAIDFRQELLDFQVDLRKEFQSEFDRLDILIQSTNRSSIASPNITEERMRRIEDQLLHLENENHSSRIDPAAISSQYRANLVNQNRQTLEKIVDMDRQTLQTFINENHQILENIATKTHTSIQEVNNSLDNIDTKQLEYKQQLEQHAEKLEDMEASIGIIDDELTQKIKEYNDGMSKIMQDQDYDHASTKRLEIAVTALKDTVKNMKMSGFVSKSKYARQMKKIHRHCERVNRTLRTGSTFAKHVTFKLTEFSKAHARLTEELTNSACKCESQSHQNDATIPKSLVATLSKLEEEVKKSQCRCKDRGDICEDSFIQTMREDLNDLVSDRNEAAGGRKALREYLNVELSKLKEEIAKSRCHCKDRDDISEDPAILAVRKDLTELMFDMNDTVNILDGLTKQCKDLDKKCAKYAYECNLPPRLQSTLPTGKNDLKKQVQRLETGIDNLEISFKSFGVDLAMLKDRSNSRSPDIDYDRIVKVLLPCLDDFATNFEVELNDLRRQFRKFYKPTKVHSHRKKTGGYMANFQLIIIQNKPNTEDGFNQKTDDELVPQDDATNQKADDDEPISQDDAADKKTDKSIYQSETSQNANDNEPIYQNETSQKTDDEQISQDEPSQKPNDGDESISPHALDRKTDNRESISPDKTYISDSISQMKPTRR